MLSWCLISYSGITFCKNRLAVLPGGCHTDKQSATRDRNKTQGRIWFNVLVCQPSAASGERNEMEKGNGKKGTSTGRTMCSLSSVRHKIYLTTCSKIMRHKSSETAKVWR